MDIVEWCTKYWGELITAIGIGGSSGFAAKRLTNKRRDRRIKSLENKIEDFDKSLLQIKKDIETNTLFDKQFRNQVEASMVEVKARLDQILGHLLNTKKK